MSKILNSLFGNISKNGDYEAKIASKDVGEITVRLFVDSSFDEVDILKIEDFLKRLDEVIDASKRRIIDLCQGGVEYAEEMTDYMNFVLAESKGKRVSDFSEEFNKKIQEISVTEFIESLKLKSIQISLKYKTIVFDYCHGRDLGEIWAVNYSLDMEFIDMTCES